MWAARICAPYEREGIVLHSYAVEGESGNALAERLQAVEDALGKSLARSDEQLAYYVAQAREVVDLSVLAQKQIIEELRQLPGVRDRAGA